jgi:hypothetical protein
MTNIYDVLSQMHVKATGSVEKAVEEELKKEDPSEEEAKAILEQAPPAIKTKIKYQVETDATPESGNESTKGNERKRSSRNNKRNLR